MNINRNIIMNNKILYVTIIYYITYYILLSKNKAGKISIIIVANTAFHGVGEVCDVVSCGKNTKYKMTMRMVE